MDDSTFLATLTEIAGSADQWLEYGSLVNASGSPIGGSMCPAAGESYERFYIRVRNTRANSPNWTPLDGIIEDVCWLYHGARPG